MLYTQLIYQTHAWNISRTYILSTSFEPCRLTNRNPVCKHIISYKNRQSRRNQRREDTMPNVIVGPVEHPSETHLKLKSCKISFVHNIHFLCLIVLKFWIEHGSIIAMHFTDFKTIGQCLWNIDIHIHTNTPWCIQMHCERRFAVA